MVLRSFFIINFAAKGLHFISFCDSIYADLYREDDFMNSVFKNHVHECDLCIIGGGLAGMCAGIAAARHGIKVIIMQDRPLYGGNASSEIRMWVSGSGGKNCRETGIIEEILLENLYRNPERSYPIWDSILYEFVDGEENITSIMNCSCLDAKCENGRLYEVLGWQTTTQSYHTVKATYFADCSGDSILAPLTGAEFRIGREGRSEFNESIAPEVSDKKTMGLTCLITARETSVRNAVLLRSWVENSGLFLGCYSRRVVIVHRPAAECYRVLKLTLVTHLVLGKDMVSDISAALSLSGKEADEFK